MILERLAEVGMVEVALDERGAIDQIAVVVDEDGDARLRQRSEETKEEVFVNFRSCGGLQLTFAYDSGSSPS